MRFSLARFVSGLLGLSLVSASAQADVLYVDADLASGANDGTSWSDAFRGQGGLQAALALAVSGDQVYVAEGSYKPTADTDRSQSFRPANGVELYGGFVGGEASPQERPPLGTAPSVLSGDLLGNDGPLEGSRQDNALHVLRLQDVDDSCIVDGFRIVAGYAKNGSGIYASLGAGVLIVSSGSGLLRNCRVFDCRSLTGGGGIHVEDTGPTIERCTIEDCRSDFGGGGMELQDGAGARIRNCVFRGNRGSQAGAIEVSSSPDVQISGSLLQGNQCTNSSGAGACTSSFGSSVKMVNCTVVGNIAPASGVGGIDSFTGSPPAENCILWGNLAGGSSQAQESQISQFHTAIYCTVEGGFPGVGNSSLDPLFVDAPGGDYSLQSGSPALDAGNNGALVPDQLQDLDGLPRRSDVASAADSGNGNAPLVDMGAFELHEPIGAPDAGCAPLPNSTGAPSDLTASGSLDLAGNSLFLAASDLPPGQFAYFVMSMSTGNTPVGSGVLCLGAPLVRFSDDVLLSSPQGGLSFAPTFNSLPQGQTFQAGETWWFQLWHRDQGGTSNLSNSLGFLWQ